MDLSVTVRNVRQEALEVKSFELVSIDGTPMPSFTAGSHIDVQVAPGLTRQYSLCNSPSDSARYLIAVKRESASRGGSAGMHERVKQGDALRISAPRNHFALVPNSNWVKPVALPPGRARLATKPAPTGSGVCANTIGILRVACSNGRTVAPEAASITSGASATNSAA